MEAVQRRLLAAVVVLLVAGIILSNTYQEKTTKKKKKKHVVYVPPMLKEEDQVPEMVARAADMARQYKHAIRRVKKTLHNAEDVVIPAVAAELEAQARRLRQTDVDCAAIIANKPDAMAQAKKVNKEYWDKPKEKGDGTDVHRNKNKNIGEDELQKQLELDAANCTQFVRQYGFLTTPLSALERDFPVAFQLIVFTDVEMIWRLLRSIYRPQNRYCIHVDKKKKFDQLQKTMTAVAKCLPGVELAEERIDVYWGSFRTIDAEMTCMKTLWKHKDWLYLINLTGQEFPILNNYELVKMLREYRGANDIPASVRYAKHNRIGWKKLPCGLTNLKGPIHFTASRYYVDFVLHDERARKLQEFLEGSWIPDEGYLSVLNHNTQLGIHGSFIGVDQLEKRNLSDMEYVAMDQLSFNRYKMWMYGKKVMFCGSGNTYRDICILGSEDLPRIVSSQKLFANKFYLKKDPVAVACLEELIANKTRDYYTRRRSFDASFVRDAAFVRQMLVNDTLNLYGWGDVAEGGEGGEGAPPDMYEQAAWAAKAARYWDRDCHRLNISAACSNLLHWPHRPGTKSGMYHVATRQD